jgi:hypothetical protein
LYITRPGARLRATALITPSGHSGSRGRALPASFHFNEAPHLALSVAACAMAYLTALQLACAKRGQPQQPNQRQHQSGEQNCQQEALDPKLGHCSCHQDDKSSSGRLPPSADTRNPPMTAVYSPLSGETPEATAMAIESGRATMATVSAAIASGRTFPAPKL